MSLATDAGQNEQFHSCVSKTLLKHYFSYFLSELISSFLRVEIQESFHV